MFFFSLEKKIINVTFTLLTERDRIYLKNRLK